MSAFTDVIERIRALVFRRREEAELAEELRFHLDMSAEHAERAGVTAQEAKRRSVIALGGVERTKEDVRDARGTRWLEDLATDVALALRTIRRAPGFAFIVIGMLAIGIGANTAIFTLIDAVVVRSLPVRDPERLVVIGDPSMVTSTGRGVGTQSMSYLLYKDIRDHQGPLESVLASGPTGRLDVLVGEGATEFEHPEGRFVSGNYFSVLGVPPFRGRVFDGSEDDAIGASPIATISHRYWTRRFQQDPSVVGSTIVVNNTRVTIVGVTPEYFTGEVVGASADLWLPVTMHDALKPNVRWLDKRNQIWLLLLGRIEPGATIAQVQADYSPFIVRMIAENATDRADDFLARNPDVPIAAGHRGFSDVRETFATPLFTIMIGVALLLCIICANVGNLLLARAIARGKEMALRLALGAGRGRLIRLLLAESLVIGAFAAVAGLLLAWWAGGALLAFASDGMPFAIDLVLNVRVLAFTIGLSVVAVALFGLVPAVRASRTPHATMLRDGSRTIDTGGAGARGRRITPARVLIGAQVALSVVLLVGAAMLSRSLRNVQEADVGLDRDHLLMLDVDIETRGYQNERLVTLAHTLRDDLARIPGVRGAAYSENGIFSGTEWSTTIALPGRDPMSAEDANTGTDNVGPGYFRDIGARLIAGRELEASDERSLARVAVVNQSFARFYFPNGEVVGQTFIVSDTVPITIVGIVADTRTRHLDAAVRRRAYFPFVPVTNPEDLRFAIRTSGEPGAVMEQVRKAVTAVDPLLVIRVLQPLPVLMRQSIRERRLVAHLASGFGILALFLASFGLYGVMSFAVKRRTSELGLRAALGAQRTDVLRLVARDALTLVAAGAVIGVPLALASTTLLRAQLQGVEPIDPVSLFVALVAMSASAAVAALLPALSAARVSPLVALRAE